MESKIEAMQEKNTDLVESLDASARSQEEEEEKISNLKMQLEETKVALDEANEKIAADEEANVAWQGKFVTVSVL